MYMISDKKPLHGIFTEIPPRYDVVNHVITLGMDVRWRWRAARECLAWKPSMVLDLCCGTGDLALNIARLAGDGVAITGFDYSQPMLEIARRKAAGLGLLNRVSFQHGDVASLPFPDECYDCIGISFAFRNLTYKNPLAKQYLAEILRVLRPGGRFVIVETSQPGSRLVRKLFHLYLRWFVYRAGCVISANRGAYRYLAESAANYYAPGELKGLLQSSGFHRFRFRPLFMGAAGICIATK
jgi:demethylmenaquinone methyltransferase/2-methoxy-6-polyprenyl-1,4-benzoquinol methylase